MKDEIKQEVSMAIQLPDAMYLSLLNEVFDHYTSTSLVCKVTIRDLTDRVFALMFPVTPHALKNAKITHTLWWDKQKVTQEFLDNKEREGVIWKDNDTSDTYYTCGKEYVPEDYVSKQLTNRIEKVLKVRYKDLSTPITLREVTDAVSAEVYSDLQIPKSSDLFDKQIRRWCASLLESLMDTGFHCSDEHGVYMWVYVADDDEGTWIRTTDICTSMYDLPNPYTVDEDAVRWIRNSSDSHKLVRAIIHTEITRTWQTDN